VGQARHRATLIRFPLLLLLLLLLLFLLFNSILCDYSIIQRPVGNPAVDPSAQHCIQLNNVRVSVCLGPTKCDAVDESIDQVIHSSIPDAVRCHAMPCNERLATSSRRRFVHCAGSGSRPVQIQSLHGQLITVFYCFFFCYFSFLFQFFFDFHFH